MTTNTAFFPTTTSTEFASLKRRLLCMVYEAILIFGIFFAADLLFELFTNALTQHINELALKELTLRHFRQLYLFIILGVYFTYFWRHNGQTLPMQTWHIKVVSSNQQKLTCKQAWLRYCGAWMWFLPALSLNYLFEIKQWPSVFVFFIGIAIWSLTSKLDKDGQFLHDKLAGTALIALPKNRQNKG